MWSFLNMNRSPEKSPFLWWYLCKQEAESPSVRMEGLERRFEVLLEGLSRHSAFFKSWNPCCQLSCYWGWTGSSLLDPQHTGPQRALRNVGSWWLGEGRGSSWEDNRIEGSQGWILRGAWVSSEQVYNGRKCWEGRQKEACQTCMYTRNFITAIKTQVRGTAKTYLMHIKTNARWFKIFQWPMRHPKPSFLRKQRSAWFSWGMLTSANSWPKGLKLPEVWTRQTQNEKIQI